MDIDTIKQMFIEKVSSSMVPVIPDALNDERLEDAFKEPIYDEQGHAPNMPCVWDSNSYGQRPDGIKILSLRSASIASSLYYRYLDEEAFVWDAAKQELFLYLPDEECPTVAFKGSSWLCAKKLKFNYWMELNIYDVYKELQSKIKEELNIKKE